MVALLFEVTSELPRNPDTSMSASSAPNTDRQVALSLAFVGWHQQIDEGIQSVEKHRANCLISEIRRDLGIASRQRP